MLLKLIHFFYVFTKCQIIKLFFTNYGVDSINSKGIKSPNLLP